MSSKIILFDAAGVLFPLNRVVGEDLAATFHLNEEQLALMWKELYPEYTLGKLTTEQFLDAFASLYHLPRERVTEEVFTAGFLRELKPMPGMEDVIATLKKAGHTLAMLSDTSEMFAHARRDLPFSQYFDHIFFSFELGIRKPDPRSFQAVIDYYKIHPEEVFFIDDSLTNVEAAKSLGMNGAVFTDSATLTYNLERTGILN
jgi:epoxide hydrolase-like predicted phosphatase